MDHRSLNALLNLVNPDGTIDLDADKRAARDYFLTHVNENTVFFHSLKEKLDYLTENDYYETDFLNLYSFDFIKSVFQKAYSYKFRFASYMGAVKYYSNYTLKTFKGDKYLERYEDRVAIVALYLAQGDHPFALSLVDEIITGRFQPATPTFLNAGRKQRGELVSCFLMRVEDNMESISRAITNSLQLSKRGGGVALNLSNLREEGAPIKMIANQSSGVIPVMKLLEDSFSYANQLGSRDGAGAVYLHAHHPDILRFLDTKKENADEKSRIKTLSLGVVIPDITVNLAAQNKEMYLFSPYDVEKVYGVPFTEIDFSHEYEYMVLNSEIRKTSINARDLFTTIAKIQFESGYPYILYEDTATTQNPNRGKITMSNLCTEILQENTPSTFNLKGEYLEIGNDISCNLGSLNIAKVMEGGDIETTVDIAIRALTSVSKLSDINCVPPIHKGNQATHAVGLGQMNLHGFFMKEGMAYGSEESLDFTNLYFYTILYYCLKASNNLAKVYGQSYEGFDKSSYADGSFFRKHIESPQSYRTNKVKEIFEKYNISYPSFRDWEELKQAVMKYGLYNKYLQAVAPTGSISYINNATASIHPVADAIEVRKEARLGRIYYPAPYLTNENRYQYLNAYQIGPTKLIDVYAEASKYVDQGLSLTLFFDANVTTREVNLAQIYAWKKDIKTLYYVRMKQAPLEGTECEACAV